MVDLDAAQNSLEFHQSVPSEFLTKVINHKDGSERFGEERFKEEESSPKKKSRRDQGQPRETQIACSETKDIGNRTAGRNLKHS